ncbi:putative aldo/keto reductase [Gordonia araii NBRC 100433]|uniref:Putative aldo/keto reductase n=1 Tax=Gordonia araii NBRC 100433 TaxID=1073574 RepID=G7H643_9ACTN|nr:aldo/keto reductase [Gordonia araii]NNG98720.1 aldo/keto reductase [Gordonia araii NBRC 100433]GAB11282.1 putative aldo/keto reductase [Gordonia araii NBRC 100433]
MTAITLNDGTTIPQFGFGTWQIPDEDARPRVAEALEAGYRHIDTAQMYGNENGVGQAIAESGIARDELYVTTKLNNNNHAPDRAIASIDDSLNRLGLDYVDLFLIHWPLPTIDIDFVDTWHAMEEIRGTGKARSIGVSNFTAEDLRRIVDAGSVVPVVNQIEVHPYFAQNELRALDAQLGVATEAWSPLAQGQVFDDPKLLAIAERVGRPVSQVVLAWHLQRGDIVFPKASSAARIRENFQAQDLRLDEADIAAIDTLDEGRRIGPDPATFDWVPNDEV